MRRGPRRPFGTLGSRRPPPFCLLTHPSLPTRRLRKDSTSGESEDVKDVPTVNREGEFNRPNSENTEETGADSVIMSVLQCYRYRINV